MPLEQHVADSSPTIQPSVRPPAANVKIPSLDGRIRGARFVSPDGPRAEMEQLADRIAELSARIQAATYELLILIRQFDQREGWSGFASCAHWLSWRIGLAPGAAREKVRVARALADLPLLSDAMRRGVVSYSKVRAVTRVATPDTEQTLLDVALAGTAAHVEQVARAWRRVDRTAEAADDRRRHASRVLHTWVDDDGMVVIRGRLAPEVGAVVRRALEAALDEQRRAAATRELGEPDAVDEAAGVAPSFGQRQADALGMVAECALAGGLDGGTAGDRYQVVVHVDTDTLAEDVDVPAGTAGTAAADTEPARCRRNVSAGTSPPARAAAGHPAGGAGRRTRADQQDPAGKRDPASNGRLSGRSSRECPGPNPAAAAQTVRRGQAALEDAGGIHVSAATAQRLACDAATVGMRHGPTGQVLDVGRKTRTISPALRRALASRDSQCRFPGCQARRCDAHHIRHWAHGGATALDNLVLLCRRHHRAVHEEGFRVTCDQSGAARFVRPDGRLLPAAPPAPDWTGLPLEPTAKRLAAAGIDIDGSTATPAWRGERLDLTWAIGILWRPRPEMPTEPGVPAGTSGPCRRTGGH